MNKRGKLTGIVKMAVSLLLTFALVSGLMGTMSLAGVVISAKRRSSFFDNPEINRLLDENHAEVEKNGYAKLRIPRSVHKMKETVFSKNALEVGHALLEAGYQAYVVGGSTRDYIMGRKNVDADITTNATIEEQRELFGDALRTHEAVGRVFGGVSFPDEEVDLSTFQNIPKQYKDLPGVPPFDPDQLTGDSLLGDSFQRDLTLNAIYYDLSNGDLLDFHDGIYDIREGILDTMVDAGTELQSDPRVLLRAIRFKARFGLDFSDDLEKAIRENGREYVKNLDGYSAFSNVRKMMHAGYALNSYHLLTEYGLFESFYPSLRKAAGDEKYRAYIERALSYMDEQVNGSGKNASPELTVLVFLQPEILKRAEESNMRDALKSVLDEEEQVFDFGDARDKIIRTSLLAERMMHKPSRRFEDSVLKSGHFSDARMLLGMMALADERFKDQADYWEEKKIK